MESDAKSEVALTALTFLRYVYLYVCDRHM